MAMGLSRKTRISLPELPYGIAAADFNGDGRMDLAVANTVDNDVSVLLQIPRPAANFPHQPDLLGPERGLDFELSRRALEQSRRCSLNRCQHCGHR